MPLSFGIPLGLLFIIVGALLFFATNNKKIAKIILGVGVAIAVLTAIAIALAVNSM